MDISSEVIHSLLPVFIVSVLGVSAAALGAGATVSVVKIFSGVLSDRPGKRKALALAGYGMAALTKPLFPLAQSFGIVVTARLLDRMGTGVRPTCRRLYDLLRSSLKSFTTARSRRQGLA
jgi:MFS family permease